MKSKTKKIALVTGLVIIGGIIIKVYYTVKKMKKYQKHLKDNGELIEVEYLKLSEEWKEKEDFYKTLQNNGVDLSDEAIMAYAEMRYEQAEFETGKK